MISIVLILILLYLMRGRYAQIASVLKGTNLGAFALSFATYTLALLFASVRLKLIARVQSIAMTYGEAASLTYIGCFFNNFLPTSIGGDVVKAYHLSKRSENKTGPYTSVFIDRAIGLVTMIFMAFIALFIAGSNVVDKPVMYMIYAITACSAVGVLFVLNESFARKFSVLLSILRPIEPHLRKAYRAINSYRHHPVLMAQTLVLSIISQLLSFVSVGILVYGIGSSISVMNILLRMPVVSMLSLLPSINGLGLREGSTVLLFGPLIGKDNAFAISILFIALMLLTSVIGGLIYVISPQFKIKLKDIEKEADL